MLFLADGRYRVRNQMWFAQIIVPQPNNLPLNSSHIIISRNVVMNSISKNLKSKLFHRRQFHLGLLLDCLPPLPLKLFRLIHFLWIRQQLPFS